MKLHRGRWCRVGVLLLAFSVGPTVWRQVRDAMSPTRSAPLEARTTLVGVANWREPLATLVGGALSVQLVDLTTGDPERVLLGATQLVVPRGARHAAWQISLPTRALPHLAQSVLVVSVVENGKLRSIASGAVRKFQYAMRKGFEPSPGDPISIVLQPAGSLE